MSSSTPSAEAESQRLSSLLQAQSSAISLFSEIESTLLKPGILESTLSQQIHSLGQERHSVRTHWHKRLVRSGPNTLAPFADNPPDREIGSDDILVIDLGPVFADWEADFGRTYVLGSDPFKIALRDACEPVWERVKKRFDERLDITGEELYIIAVEEAEKDGWKWGADIAGHLVGDFPHERIPNDKLSLYITPGNDTKMRQKGKGGWERHWILEVHLRSPDGKIGAFFEQLLTC